MLRIFYIFRLNSKKAMFIKGGQNDRTEKIVRNEIQIQALGYTTKNIQSQSPEIQESFKAIKKKGRKCIIIVTCL